jgi:hypothetical protein
LAIKIKDYLILLFLLLVTTVLIYTDRSASGFWSKHAFITGVLTGFVTLAITIFGVDRFGQYRDARRWEFVAHVAYRGLARVSRDVAASFASLYCDVNHPVESAYKEADFRTDCLTPLGEIRRFPEGRDQIGAYFDPNLPRIEDSPDARLPKARIFFLLKDHNWVEMAASETATLVDLNRRAVAEWATLLMNSSESRKQLNYFSRMNDGIFRLSVELGRYKVDRDLSHISEIWRLFQLNDLRARCITNNLWHLAAEDNYKFVLHEDHKNIKITKLFEEQAEGGLLSCFEKVVT